MKKKMAFVPMQIVGHTYRIDGRILTQAEALALLRADGEPRFAKLHSSVGELPGTLVCRSNPLMRVHSIEAAEAALVERRKKEGHWGKKQFQFELLAVPAAGSGFGSLEAN